MSEKKQTPKFKGALLALISAISREIPVSEDTQFLIYSKLDTEAKVQAFNTWLSTKFDNSIICTNEAELLEKALEIAEN